MAKGLLALDDANFDGEVLQAGVPVTVEFGATWCGPCRALAPVVRALATERTGQLEVGEVDVDESPSIAARFKVRSVPTILVFAGGKERARHVGLTSRAKLAELVDAIAIEA